MPHYTREPFALGASKCSRHRPVCARLGYRGRLYPQACTTIPVLGHKQIYLRRRDCSLWYPLVTVIFPHSRPTGVVIRLAYHAVKDGGSLLVNLVSSRLYRRPMLAGVLL